MASKAKTIGTQPGAAVDLETNKAVALRLIEVFNSRRLNLLEDVLHPGFRGRGISAFAPGEHEVGPGARRKLYEMFLQAIPDARGEVLDVVAEGDKVVLVDRFGGSHRGEFLGRPGSGDRIEWMAIHIYTIRDGKVLEDAYMRDELAIINQLGLAPSLTPMREQEISNRAYEIYLERGAQPGHEVEDWLQAERELTTQSSD
jgi:predicted ester cyclase